MTAEEFAEQAAHRFYRAGGPWQAEGGMAQIGAIVLQFP
jgi:hypothetical protein